MLVMTIISTISFLVMVFVLPESPVWFLIKGRTPEAIAVFNYIGRINGVSKRIPETAIFVESRKMEEESMARSHVKT